jgi:CubicO group peptidase (beta-lactamase class C family)
MDANYGVLARVVEVVSGQPFSDYLHEHIFTPLQMAHTFNVITPEEVASHAEQIAQGHLLAYALPIASPEEHGILGGSGGVISTAEDMAHYLIMHNNRGRFQGVQLLSPDSVAQLHTPPAAIDSDYAMGWVAMSVDGILTLQHNGILSTFYAEMVLLPETGQGVVLLYNVQSQLQDALGFPPLKNGLIALLMGNQPQTGGVSVGVVGILLAAITLLSLTLQGRALLRLPRWMQRAPAIPLWRRLLGIIWAFVPAALVLAMPTVVLRTSGRAFGYRTLFRSMLDVMLWLALSGVLGAVIGIARLVRLARRDK